MLVYIYPKVCKSYANFFKETEIDNCKLIFLYAILRFKNKIKNKFLTKDCIQSSGAEKEQRIIVFHLLLQIMTFK